MQPVFHIYDLQYYICSPHIILDELPKTNKFCNFQNIETKNVLTTIEITDITNFTQEFFLRNKNKENRYLPKKENIMPYFPVDQKDPNFFSFYKEKDLKNDTTTGNISESSKNIAIITSRPVSVSLNKGFPFQVYYVDYLCVDPSYRKRGIAPQMIQTHEYKQRQHNHNIKVSLFKKEGDMTGIVPLTFFNTVAFDMQKWTEPEPLLPIVSLLECSKTNFHFVLDFLKEGTSKFEATIMPSIEIILELIQTKNIYIYFLLKDHDIKAVYFFRKTCIFIRNGQEVLSCYAAINNCKNSDLFIHGFKVAIFKIRKFQFLCIEDMSDNNILITNLKKKTVPYVVSPTAYFLYNYVHNPINNNKVLILI